MFKCSNKGELERKIFVLKNSAAKIKGKNQNYTKNKNKILGPV